MPTQFFDQIFTAQFLVRAFLVLFLVFYFFFSVLLIRQVQIMTAAIKTTLNQFLRLLGLVNFSIAIIFLILAIFLT